MNILISAKTVSQRHRPFDLLEKIAENLGLEVVNDGTNDVRFFEGRISIGEFTTQTDKEERLAHELGHFLVAPKSRRWLEDYGHQGELSRYTKEREELAAAVLGMALQLHVGSRINMFNNAYLWTRSDDFWYEGGFWLGAANLLRQGWILENFALNAEKLKESFTWKKRSF